MEDLAVLKFGGTSVKNLARIQHVADVIASTAARKKIVVVSAMGDTTDYLCSLAKQCSAAPDKRELDMLLVTGEQVSIALLALTLKARGVGCKSFTGAQIGIQTDDRHSAARIIDIDKEKLDAATNEHEVVIVAGFQGLSGTGEITTLGRGGSDTTAVMGDNMNCRLATVC
jgi:aspartate kinase